MASTLTGKEQLVVTFMDRKTDLTFFDYLFLRKVASAVSHCGDAGYFLPTKLYCGLSITSPRAPVLSAPEEKAIYLSAIILTDGFYYG